MKDTTHPVYGIVRLGIYMTGLVLTLMLTSTKFDETELYTIITMFLIGTGAEGLHQYLHVLKAQSNSD